MLQMQTCRRESAPVDRKPSTTKSFPEHHDSDEETRREKIGSIVVFVRIFHVCRICLAEEDAENLISPCECRGTQAVVHVSCLNHWFEVMNTTACQVCKTEYTMERKGFKNWREWSWPKPLSESWEDELDFRCAFLWFIFATRMLFMFLVRGRIETLEKVSDVLGEGKLYAFWWTSFGLNMVYYLSILYLVIDNWITANSAYSWKDRRERTSR
uniref:RING-CH-type domain-containing protein n=1 Tax=Steinernema glaseri TaxID=37863 RepID=A0A1I7XWI4_9BILA